MTKTSLLVCHDPRGPQWQLGPLPPAAGRIALVGWKQEPAPMDDGVPGEVAAVLARALTSEGEVTFPSSVAGSDGIRVLPATFTERIARARDAGRLTLASTRDADVVQKAFDDPAYPWWLQGQVFLLSAPAARPPDVERREFLRLFEDDWTTAAQALAPLGVTGVLRPGVDGAVAALFAPTERLFEASLAALAREARAASLAWSVVTEDAFAVLVGD